MLAGRTPVRAGDGVVLEHVPHLDLVATTTGNRIGQQPVPASDLVGFVARTVVFCVARVVFLIVVSIVFLICVSMMYFRMFVCNLQIFIIHKLEYKMESPTEVPK